MAYDVLDVAAVYIAAFVTRDDIHQVWTKDGWRPVNHPLTPQIVVDAITKKGPPVGAYLPRPDNRTHVWAVDFDTEKGLDQALSLGRTMWEDGIPCYAEASRRGAHLWGSLDGYLDAKPIRRFLRAEIDKAKLPRVWDPEAKLWVDDPKIELRPASDRIGEGGTGSALRLPTMPHPATGKRYNLLHPATGKPVGDSLAEALLYLSFGDPVAIASIAAEWVPEVDPRTIDRRYSEPRAPREHDEYDDMSVSEILQQHFGVANARPRHAVKCPKHDDRVASLSISQDDRRIWCKSASCEWYGNGKGLGTYQLMKAVRV